MTATTYDQSLRAIYLHYLTTQDWKDKRQAALRFYKFRCALNVHHGWPLEVHHRSYQRLGQEELIDLIVLCAGCHERFHDRLPTLQPFKATPPTIFELS